VCAIASAELRNQASERAPQATFAAIVAQDREHLSRDQ
jgi:hypothetical protein